MSSPQETQYQYVYIPNLVGRQMLRIPIEEVEAENTIPTSAQGLSLNTSSSSTTSSAFSRETSPAPSVESVEGTE